MSKHCAALPCLALLTYGRQDYGSSWFNPAVYGAGAGFFYISYSLCMVPAQLGLLRFGPSNWLGSMVLFWGAVATGALCSGGPAA